MNNCEWDELYLSIDFPLGLGWNTWIFPQTHILKQQNIVYATVPHLHRTWHHARHTLVHKQCICALLCTPMAIRIMPGEQNTFFQRVFSFFLVFLRVFFLQTCHGTWKRMYPPGIAKKPIPVVTHSNQTQFQGFFPFWLGLGLSLGFLRFQNMGIIRVYMYPPWTHTQTRPECRKLLYVDMSYYFVW